MQQASIDIALAPMIDVAPYDTATHDYAAAVYDVASEGTVDGHGSGAGAIQYVHG